MSGRPVSRVPRAVLALVVIAALFVPVDAHAAWPRYPDVNLPIATGAGLQIYPAILEDGAGGAFIAWHDNRSAGYDIYVQRVSAAGVPLWTTNGVVICSAAGDQYNTQLASDGAGGVIVTWHDFRSGDWDVYVQRLDANGVVQWTANGVALCTATGTQLDPNIVSDGQGGAVIAWQDARSGTQAEIYARRVNAAGTPQWTANGVLVSVGAGTREKVRLVADGAGGSIVTWQDWRGGVDVVHVFAQRLNASGVPQWIANGVLVSDVADRNRDPAILSDGAGGAYIAWMNVAGIANNIRMQRLSSAGARLWSAGGVSSGGGGIYESTPQLVSDGAGGVIASFISHSSYFRTFAQRMSSAGARMWGGSAVAVSTTSADHEECRLASDGSGGAIVVWRIPATRELQAQRVNANGSVVWGAAPKAISSTYGDRAWPRIAADGAGGAIITWHDTRSGTYDVYAQRVDHHGYLGHVEPVITSVRDVPNDQGGRVKVSWSASPLDAPDPNFGITEYRVWRSVPQAGASHLEVGTRRATTTDPDVAAAGDALLLTSTADAVTAWELVGYQPPVAFPAYSFTAYTTSDSLPDSNPRTLFMIEARGGTSVGSPRWFSAPDSGYSVDNLSPTAPSGLAASWANGTTSLTWAANGEEDLSGYRLCRGATADFLPSSENRIASPSGTSHDDPSGIPAYYKLSAVDSNGNESGLASLSPAGTLDAPGDGVPVVLRLGSLEPNPARAVTRVTFDLPRAAHVSLVVYDASGRAVRELVRGERPAGAFATTWDLRDDMGRRVANGIYFVRLAVESRTLTRRIVVMR